VLDGEKVLTESPPLRLRFSGTGGICCISQVAGLEPGQRLRTAGQEPLKPRSTDELGGVGVA
jgi:hypothetical protein